MKFDNIVYITLLIVNGFSTARAYDVYCNFNSHLGNSYCGDIASISPITSADEQANIVSQPSMIDNETITIYMNNNPMNLIPTDLFNHLIAIQIFAAIQTGLTTVTSNAFINCKLLVHLALNRNPFTNLPASFAEQCNNVITLSLNENEITTIDENAFKGMYGLQNIDARLNKITCLPPLLFQDNKELETIEMSNNFITALHPLLFQNMPKLYSVIMENNSLSYIPDLSLNNTGSQDGFNLLIRHNSIMAINPLFLTHLYRDNLNSNNIDYKIFFSPVSKSITSCAPIDWQYQNWLINPFEVNGQNWVQQNDAYNNSTSCYSNWSPQMADDSLVTCVTQSTTTTTFTTTTSEISTENPVSCSSYRVCRYYLDYLNRYTCVIDGADGSVSAIGGIHSSPFTDANVERVYFVNSQLSRIPNVLFEKFPNLNFLYVRSCGMGVINDHTFNACGNLQFLDASFNDIIHIDETSLRNCTKLETIDLTGNPLDYVSTQLYVYDPSLKKIHFNRNADFSLA